jgi:hypothetical protein
MEAKKRNEQTPNTLKDAYFLIIKGFGCVSTNDMGSVGCFKSILVVGISIPSFNLYERGLNSYIFNGD